MTEAIGSVMARIGAIEQRFAPADVTDPAAGPVPVIDRGPTFDAFGEVYQNAVVARATAPTIGLPAAGQAGLFAPAGNQFTLGSPNGGSPGASGSGSPLVTAAITGVVAAPGERKVGGYGKLPVPDALAAFGNGRIPSADLTPLATQPGHKLHAPAAASWNNLVAAASADGIELKITDSYRDYDEQVDLVRRKGLYSQGGLAATPGTSNHGWGMAVDANVNDPRTLQWLKTNGPRFGWVEAVPRETWHWEFRPDQV